ncbi:MAG: hypothetical protein L6Q54_05585 [Leptospiraceae bacterium]|nr:hypothetical protein [Leptospiraceae bacterium]MCK6380710.1 hypothetical protein [Leptospiraceae bacterium]NUM41246.1 hypothetical protein [Leptospiraceae bacterium]
MKVDLREKVSKLQEKFKSEFGIGIRVYKGAKFAPDVAIKELIEPGHSGEEIEIAGQMKVGNVEKLFMDKFGIKTQIEDQSGNLADNSATIASLRK